MRECPVCSSTNLHFIIKRDNIPVYQNMPFANSEHAKDIKKSSLQLFACKECEFIFNASFEDIAYGDGYENEQNYSTFFSKYTDDLAIRIVDCIKKKEFDKVTLLEIGCGQGSFLKKIIQRLDIEKLTSFQVYGFDPAYKKECDNNVENIKFFPLYFDEESKKYIEPCEEVIVICRHVIEHIKNPKEFIEQLVGINSLSSGGGVLFLETPDADWIINNYCFWDFVYEHCSYFNKNSIKTLLNKYDFTINNVENIFNDQYMWIESEIKKSLQEDTVKKYQSIENEIIGSWKNKLKIFFDNEEKIVLWGAGAKGVVFANILDKDLEYIAAVVDVNPKKQGKFLSGTGHRIIAAEDLLELKPKHIIIMNPNYEEEIKSIVARMNLGYTPNFFVL